MSKLSSFQRAKFQTRVSFDGLYQFGNNFEVNLNWSEKIAESFMGPIASTPQKLQITGTVSRKEMIRKKTLKMAKNNSIFMVFVIIIYSNYDMLQLLKFSKSKYFMPRIQVQICLI